MRRLLPLMIAAILLLSSCSYPFQQSTPNAQDLATKVAQTLTAWPTFPSTQTPVPTSILSTLTVTPTSASTASATPTISPDDPVLSLGESTYSDTFTSGSAFGLKTPYEDNAIHIEATDGSLVFRSLAVHQGWRWRLTSRMARNLYVEGTFTTVSCAGLDHYGLMFRAPTYDDGVGYYVALSCDGQTYMQYWDGSKSHTLLDWTAAPSALTGKNQTNRLGVMVKEHNFAIYVNGILVKTVGDDELNEKGHFGVFVSALDTPNFTFKLDEIKEWDLP